MTKDGNNSDVMGIRMNAIEFYIGNHYRNLRKLKRKIKNEKIYSYLKCGSDQQA